MDDAAERLAASGAEYASTRMERLIEGPAPDLSSLGRVFVLAGSENVPLYTQWLSWLASGGASVVVAIEHLGGGSPLFAGGKEIARSLDAPIPDLAETPWYGEIFHAGSRPGEPLDVRVSSTADPLSECEWAIRGCIEAIGRGFMPHRIAVIARDTETYVPLLTLSAARLGAPLTASVRVPLATIGFASLTASLLASLASPDVRPLSRIALSSYFGLDADARSVVREAISAACRGADRSWDMLVDWAETESDDRAGWLRPILRWRDEALREPVPMAQWIERLRALWQTPPLPETVSGSVNPTQERDVRARNAMERALVDRALVEDPLRERALGLRQFASLCDRLWGEEEVALPAATLRGVQVVSSPEQLGECEAVFVLGMLEGVIPRRRSEDPILSDEERLALADLLPRHPKLPTSFDRARSERDVFVRMCASAERLLAFSYPQVDDDRDNVPAFYLSRIAQVFSPSVSRDYPRSLVAPLVHDCKSPADLALRRALDGPRARLAPATLESEEARAALVAPLEAGIEPREFEAVRSCPFMSSCRHRLGVFPSARRTAWARLRRLAIQAGLAVQRDPDSARIALEKALEEDRVGLAGTLDDWESSLLDSAGKRLIPGLVDREFRARSLWHADDQERTADVKLAGPDFRDEIQVSGRKVRIQSRASALSKIQGYRVLHLFESSVPDDKTGDEAARERFKYRLGLTLLPAYTPEGLAAEVDGLNGSRTLFLVPRREGTMPHGDASAGLKVSVLGDTLQDFFSGVKSRLAESVEALAAPTMEVRPGDSCDRCDYGELCRFSKVFGEQLDRFAEGESPDSEEDSR